MSQTANPPQPRRANLRGTPPIPTPNGSTSPAPQHSRPSSTRPPRQHHSKPYSQSRPAGPEESEEMRALRSQYGPQLKTLKELFGDWSDADLLSALADTSGHVESVAVRISEGQIEQWGEVHHKKDKRATASSSAAGGHGASGSRGGSSRGGRGGGTGRGGSRGASRGTGRGGINGHHGYPGSPSLANATVARPGDADPSNEGAPLGEETDATASWGEAAKLEDQKDTTKSGPISQGQDQVASKQAPVKPTPPAPAVKTWAQIAKPKARPTPPPTTSAAPTSTQPPASSTPASKPDTESQAPAPAPLPSSQPGWEDPTTAQNLSLDDIESTQTTEADEQSVEPTPTADAEAPSGPSEQDSAHIADDWIAVTPQKETAELLPVTEVSKEKPEVKASEPAPEPPAPQVQILDGTSAPPGLPAPSVNSSSLSATSSPAPAASTTVSTPATSVAAPAAKPSTPRPHGAHRTASRFKTDAAVVMPGNIGIPSTGFGGLSFGTGVIGSGISSFGSIGLGSGLNGVEKFGMQFGSLSLGGDDNFDSAPAEPLAAPQEPIGAREPEPTPAAVEPTPAKEPSPSPAPVAAIPEPAPAPKVPSPAVQPSPAPAAATTATTNIYQTPAQPQPSSQPSLPQQVSAPIHVPAPAPVAPVPVSSIPPFTSQQPQTAVPAPGLQHPQPQPQQPYQQPQTLQHLAQQQQQQQPSAQQLGGYQGHQLPPHLSETSSSIPQQAQQPASAHPATSAQSSYFRGVESSPYFHHASTPQQQSQIGVSSGLQNASGVPDHSSPYGAFAPLGGQQGSGGVGVGGGIGNTGVTSHLGAAGGVGGAFGSSPAPADYGAYGDTSRFYESYSQGGFQSRNALGHEDATKTGLGGTNQAANTLGQNGPQSTTPQGQQQQQQFPGMVPYYGGYQQPYYMQNPSFAHYNPYGAPQPPYVKYPPHYGQPGPVPPPGPQQAKPPAASSIASPYGSQQSHLHYPAQNSPYDDPAVAGYQQAGSNQVGDYGKQGIYGGGGNFFGGAGAGNQGPGQGQGPQGLGNPRANTAAGGVSQSQDNQYKGYGAGPGGADKQNQQGGPGVGGQQGRGGNTAGVTGAGTGAAGGGPQPQQGGYYNPNRYSNHHGIQPPSAPGYPQDGQFYPSYQQPRQGYWG
ncbi:hypothetical protein FRC02_002075 [Tulasnella sp. 418]|nr:hypothetical protein FRC02_002075 [Tulasnella sp. 418]